MAMLKLMKLCSVNSVMKQTITYFSSGRSLIQTHISSRPVLNAHGIIVTPVRNVNFMNTLTGEQLWKSVTSVSNVGRQKGRGKGKRSRDLNRGQMLGKGKVNYQWPGLNAPVFDRNENLQIKKMPYDKDYHEHILEERTKVKTGFRRLKLKPLDRGFSGTKWPGRKLGPPEPVGAESFEGFETICLRFRQILIQTGNLGKKKYIETIVVTGNRNGTIGFGKAFAPDGRAALRKAKKAASKRLITFERYENRTIYHNIFSQFHNTRVYMMKGAEGYGLVCHRIIKVICQMLGIKDLYAKVEGASKNVDTIVKSVIAGMFNQKSHQEIADETGMYIVEQHPDRDNYPVIVGVPSKPRHTLSKNEATQVKMVEKFLQGGEYFAEGKIYHFKPYKPWYWDTPEYHKREWQQHLRRNKPDMHIRMWASDHEWDKKFLTHIKHYLT